MVVCDLNVIDLSEFASRKLDIARQLLNVGTEIEFFYICGHGIAQTDIDAAFELNKGLFALPREYKETLANDRANKGFILGYSAERMKAGILREGYLSGFDNSRMQQIWPGRDHPAYKPGMVQFMLQCHEIRSRASGQNWLQTRACCNNHCPAVEGVHLPERMLRSIAHTDFEILTLLFQQVGQPGLEVCPGKMTTRATVKSQGTWIPMDPKPGCITCNIGDALQYLSDDCLKSTYHRVRTPRPHEYKGARASMAYFANVRNSTVLQGPLKKYPALTFNNILAMKLQAPTNQIEQKVLEEYSPEDYLKYQDDLPVGPEYE
ncbi:hypothetical protein WJX74_006251 [Apatococcus lobatus]|uniref:Fe2OG dioxygenase domain-containing protein n=1 Tax=Apatococcus lobatus TaxID=904363 RepID=A0AAW1RIF8_9CHLO